MEATAQKREQHCSIEGCKRPYRAKGYCVVHFKKWRRGELDAKPRYKICGEEKCRKPLFRKGYCEEHYASWTQARKGGAPVVEAKAGSLAEGTKEAETPVKVAS